MRKFPVFLILVLLATSVMGASSSLKDIDLSDDHVKVGEEFDVEVRVSRAESGQKLHFYVDDYEFKTVNVGTNTVDVRVEYDDNEWDMHELTCGVHTIRVVLKRGNTSIDEISETLEVGNLPKITLEPENMLAGRTNKIILKDRDSGNALSSVKIEIYNTRTGDRYEKTTNIGGTASFNPKNSGKYRLTITGKYCGKLEFYAKKKIVIDGPRPTNPVVNEVVTIALSTGVGAKLLTMDGELYKALYTTIGGGVNFTIESAGSYILSLGDLSRTYWARNVSINVSSKEVPEVTISPARGVIGEVVSIEVKSNGAPLGDTYVTVTAPDNSFDIYTTTSSGKIVYNPKLIGEYFVNIEKDRYASVQKTFSTRNDFKVAFNPAKPRINEVVVMTVRSQLDNTVSDISVTIIDLTSGMTDSLGRYNFSLPKAETYEVRLMKTRYWDYAVNVSAFGLLTIDLGKTTIELGKNITIGVADQSGSTIETTITATRDGAKETISNVFAPSTPGVYNITVEKNGYLSDSRIVEVLPHPIEVLFDTDRDVLTIKLESHGSPVSGISVSLDGDEAVSDEWGEVMFSIRTGEFDIGVNQVNTIASYEIKTLSREIGKEYSILLLIVPVSLVAILAFAMILLITGRHKKIYLIHDGLKKIILKTGDEGALKKGTKSKLSEL